MQYIVKNKTGIIHEGTLKECFDYLLANHAEDTVAEIIEQMIMIEPKEKTLGEAA